MSRCRSFWSTWRIVGACTTQAAVAQEPAVSSVACRQLQHAAGGSGGCSSGASGGQADVQLCRASDGFRSRRHTVVERAATWRPSGEIRIVSTSASSNVSLMLAPGSHTVVISASAAGPPVKPWFLAGFLCGGSCAALGLGYAYTLGLGSNHRAGGGGSGPVHLALGLGGGAEAGSASGGQLAPLGATQEVGGGTSGLSWRQLAPLLYWPFGTASASAADLRLPPSCLPTPWLQAGDAGGGSGSRHASPSTGTSNAALMRHSMAEAAAAVAPAVVHLVVTDKAGSGNSGGIFDSGRSGSGSGFIYDASGYILTNAHVVAGAAAAAQGACAVASGARGSGARGAARAGSTAALRPLSSPQAGSAGGSGSLMVHLADGRVFEGSVVAMDRPADLAVVRIASDARDAALPAARLGSSTSLRAGEWVLALGSPLLLKQSVTAGIVSCVERKGAELGIHTARTEFIQTDAAVNSGNSGGPLINLDGQVVAINNMKALAADGVSFAIPIDSVKSLVEELGRYGRVLRPYVGIAMAEINDSRMRQLRASCPDFPSEVARGVLITRVAPGSPAAAAGLQEDDVIVGAGRSDQPLSMGDLADAFKEHIGLDLQLRLVRPARATPPAAKRSSVGGGSCSSSGAYSYVDVAVRPLEAQLS